MRRVDVSKYRHSDSISIDRPPEDVYAIVSDITRVGELSPVCQSCSWDDPSQASKVGARFTGHNALGDYGWDTHCEVVAAEPGREFAFVNHGPDGGDVDLVRWGYTFETEGDGTKVTESWEVLPAYPDFVGGDDESDIAARIDGMADMARDGIAQTLANLKRVAES